VLDGGSHRGLAGGSRNGNSGIVCSRHVDESVV
jgi:hypothetical protein